MKKWLLGTAVAMSVLALAGCGADKPATTAEATGYPIKWEEKLDGNTYQEQVTKAPQRAVSMSQATTEMLLALGLEKQMAGTAFKEEDIYEPLQAAYEKVPVLAEKWPSYEVFIAAKPDFTTGWPVPFTKRGIEASKIREAGVPTYVPDSMQKNDATLDTLFEDMLTIGKIFNASDKAEKWVAEQKKHLAAAQEKLKNLPEKRVFVFDSEDDQPFTVFEGYTTSVLKLIGAKNVMSGLGSDKTWAKASWEDVIARDPEYIIIVDYGTSIRNTDDFDAKVAALKANPALQNMTAVREGHFIRVKLSEITPGVRTVAALERLAKEIHGLK